MKYGSYDKLKEAVDDLNRIINRTNGSDDSDTMEVSNAAEPESEGRVMKQFGKALRKVANIRDTRQRPVMSVSSCVMISSL